MLETRLHERIKTKKQELDSLRPLPQAAVRRLNEEIVVAWTYNSNAIEGSTLTLRETQLILETGLTIGGKSMREHFEVLNHRDAIGYVETLVNEETPLTPFHVREIHALVLKNVDDDNAGQYRELSVRIGGSDHQPPDAWEVARLMNEWGDWLNGDALQEDSITRAAVAHHRFVAIHPFIDGNGRTARLLMNLLLMRDGYPPSVIQQINRAQYYTVLAQADRGNSSPLVNFVGRAVEQSLTLYLQACKPMLAPPTAQEKWIRLKEAAEASPYTQEYLSLLARLGRLEAMKRGRVWYTTLQAVEEYQNSVKASDE